MKLESHLLLNVVGYGGSDGSDFPQELQISNGDECVWYVIKHPNNAIQDELLPSAASQTELSMMNSAGQIIKNHPQSS